MQDAPDAPDLVGIFLELDKHPLLLGATRAVHREDGVTELMDGRGTVKASLPTEDFEAIARWRERPPQDE
jgi:hypothetical protein